MAVICDVWSVGARWTNVLQEVFVAVMLEVVREITATQVPAALAATVAWYLSGTRGCVCSVFLEKIWQ